MKRSTPVLVAFLLTFSAAANAVSPAWLPGLWFKTLDEDGSPGDFIEFLPNGTAKLFGYCMKFQAGQFDLVEWHEFSGDIYMTIEVERKGPIALVFRPSADRTALTFTSPRQRMNATYEKRDPKIVCPGKKAT
jgi:hypothetical protein